MIIQSVRKYGTTSPEHVTDLDVVYGSNSSCNDGFDKVNLNLNYGVGGEEVYLCFKKSPSGARVGDVPVITDIVTKATYPGLGFPDDCPVGYQLLGETQQQGGQTIITGDNFNEGAGIIGCPAGGGFCIVRSPTVYMCYKKEVTPLDMEVDWTDIEQ